MSNNPTQKKEAKTLTDIIPPWIGAIAAVITIFFLIQDKCQPNDTIEKETPSIIVYNSPPKEKEITTPAIKEIPPAITTKKRKTPQANSTENNKHNVRLMLSRRLQAKDQILLADKKTTILSNLQNVKVVGVPILHKYYTVKLIISGDTIDCSTIQPVKENELIPLNCDH